MSYDDRDQASGIQVLVATSTFTASGHVLTATPAIRYALPHAAALTGARSVVLTAGTSSLPVVSLALGGTIGLSIATSHTAAAVSSAQTDIANIRGTAGEVPVVTIVHTGTASAAQVTPVLELTLLFE